MTITKRGNSYRIRVSLGYDSMGKRIMRSKTYKPDPSLTAKQAEKEAQRQGIIFETQCKNEFKPERCLIFRQVADEWLAMEHQTNNLKTSTLTRLEGLKLRTYEYLGDLRIDKITYQQIQKFILNLSKDLSQKTQKHYITFVSDVMRYALKCGMIQYNPCRDISTVKTETDPKEAYTLQEVQEILYLINSEAPTKYKVFFNLLAFTGMRRGELLGLEFSDISFDTGVLSIMRTSNYQNRKTGTYTGTPKTKTSQRQLYLQPEVLDLIKRLQYEQRIFDTDRLFITDTGSPMHPNTPYTWLERFCKRNNLIFRGLHSFRHFVATQAIANGVNIKDVSSLLGHSQTSTTLNIYAHCLSEANKDALNSLAKTIQK